MAGLKVKRFWVARGGSYSLADGGYLADPEDAYGSALHPDSVRDIDGISDRRFLVLLGEPGIGKTTALEELKRASTGPVVYRDLSVYSTDHSLNVDVFGSADLKEAIGSSEDACLLLDSLDECRVHIATAARLLAEGLRRIGPARLKVRIACRTADWPDSLGQVARELWGEGDYGEFEMLPLRRADVISIARDNGVDAAAFLGEVRAQGLEALAMRPLTLGVLLQRFRVGGKLPTRPVDVMLAGCEALCEEPNRWRVDSGAVGTLAEGERLWIAQQIAATTVLSGRSSVRLPSSGAGGDTADLDVTDLAWGRRSASGQAEPVKPDDVVEVLGTGLFSGRPAGRMGWAHAIFSEILAARFLITRGLREVQIQSLLTTPEVSGRRRVIPQLREVAAWCAAMSPSFASQLIEADPGLLVRPSVAGCDARTREAIVRSLLLLAEDGRLTPSERHQALRFERLDHQGLADQLREYVGNRSRPSVARRMAIDIAEACRTTVLIEDLIAVALDATEEYAVRTDAAYAVARIGGSADKDRLRPLLESTRQEDPNDELKGVALSALWPDSIDGEELFRAHLTMPRNPSFFGAYVTFLRSLEETVRDQDLGFALQWVARQRGDHFLPSVLGRLPAAIMKRAWAGFGKRIHQREFAEAAIARLKRHDPILSRKRGNSEDEDITSTGNTEGRRVLLEELLGGAMDLSRENPLLWRVSSLASPDDFSWLLQQVQRSAAPVREAWARVAEQAFRPGMTDHMAVLTESEEDESLAPLVGQLRAIGTHPVAVFGEDQDVSNEARDSGERERTVAHPPIGDLVAKCLDEVEAGDLDGWWKLNFYLTLAEDSDEYEVGAELVGDLTRHQGWKSLDAIAQGRCLDAAEEYIRGGEPRDAEWLGTNALFRPAAAGYRAFRLLQELRPEAMVRVTSEALGKWAGIILSFPEYDEETAVASLVGAVLRAAPERVCEVLDRLVGAELDRHGAIYVLRRLAGTSHPSLTSYLVSRARSRSLPPGALRTVLEEIVARDEEVGASLALEFASSWKDGGETVERSVAAVVVALEVAATRAWLTLAEMVESAPETAMKALQELAERRGLHGGGFRLAAELEVDALRDLVLFLYEKEPRERSLASGFVPPHELVIDLRDSILRALVSRGTTSAVAALQNLCARRPDKPWMATLVREAEEERLSRAWPGVDIATIQALSEAQSARFIQSNLDLLDVVVESLDRLQVELKGETPTVRGLWNEDKGRGHTPKDETHLSDIIKVHLKRDLVGSGVVVNREVQISRQDKTDVRVEAIRELSGGLRDAVSVTLEVKGCWNRDLKTSMREQLVGRYLQRGTRCGIYVVGWFQADSWADHDWRKTATPKWSLSVARKELAEQAEGLSEDGVCVRAVVLDASFE